MEKLESMSDPKKPGLVWKTYDEWKTEGYHVNRGEKSTERDVFNKPLFSRMQVSFDEESDDE